MTKLEGDPGCPCHIASSVYETKPVHYPNMISKRVTYLDEKKIKLTG